MIWWLMLGAVALLGLGGAAGALWMRRRAIADGLIAGPVTVTTIAPDEPRTGRRYVICEGDRVAFTTNSAQQAKLRWEATDAPASFFDLGVPRGVK